LHINIPKLGPLRLEYGVPFTMINTTAKTANSNSGSAIAANFKMKPLLEKNLSAKLNGLLALGLLAVSAPAAQPAALPVNLPLFFEASQVLAASRHNSLHADMITSF